MLTKCRDPQTSSSGEDDRLIYGVSAMQGWRISMEDSHTTVLNLLAGSKAEKAHPSRLSFFGVFDGHGGDKVALFAGENIHNIIAKQDTFQTGDYEQALKDGFLATDRAILNGMIFLHPRELPSIRRKLRYPAGVGALGAQTCQHCE